MSETSTITWRPTGTRIVAYAISAILIALTIALGVALPEEIAFYTADRVTLTLILVGTLLGLHAVGRSKVTADAEGVHVLNGFRRRHIEWNRIQGFSMKTGAPWPTLVTVDDDRVMLFAIQGTDGSAASRALDELVRRLEAAR